MAVFLVEYTYPPEKLPLRDEHRPAHRAWLSEQVDAGRMLIAGPLTDGSGGLFLVRGDDADSTREFVAADPFQQVGGVSAVRVQEWTPVFGPFTA
ncbi:hypothetical protein HH308_01545 [Gordonia sp. TBRC 11910]|uniref:YCII-related domain-containing protein n=2 Tax=Gordonia asplenii TaxID=2725283 RepID=A0A848KPN3_9ACTN|nr:YciI family protein [Gordonia asplenii]NMN99896.1 hypothetical protein [Gordonia asplenii]